MKILGLREIKYIDRAISAHNCNFTYSDEEFTKHTICAELSDKRKVEIELSTSEGECGSGWTFASWGQITVTEVKQFKGYTHMPIKSLVVPDVLPGVKEDNISNIVFSYDSYGYDNYYPSGGYTVNMELFRPTARAKTNRMVWLFTGPSGAGKSWLASHLGENLTVYETDSHVNLPKAIVADVIVLGNKHPFTVDEVRAHIFGEVELHVVTFS